MKNVQPPERRQSNGKEKGIGCLQFFSFLCVNAQKWRNFSVLCIFVCVYHGLENKGGLVSRIGSLYWCTNKNIGLVPHVSSMACRSNKAVTKTEGYGKDTAERIRLNVHTCACMFFVDPTRYHKRKTLYIVKMLTDRYNDNIMYTATLVHEYMLAKSKT